MGQLTAVDVRDCNERICGGGERGEALVLSTGHWALSTALGRGSESGHIKCWMVFYGMLWFSAKYSKYLF